ncbi:MAG: PTS sugar transporter subunit IIB [Erysipelothrix sp.]|nr:PTS sugar transporter subunit IIB [Erysipelothrix sp.]
MIKLVRLDERLIHGQVAIKWSRHTGVDRILVLDDEAAGNELIKKTLLMAAPSTVKAAIKDVDSGIEILNDPRMETVKVLVLVSNPTDLLRVTKEVKGIPLINIGNYGRIADKVDNQARTTYRSNLYAYPEEVEILKEVIASNIPCEYQPTPEDAAESLKNVLNK